MPSGGKLESGALVRIVIQCRSSQLLAGITTWPLNVAPACSCTTSPQEACESAGSMFSPARIIQVLPGEGVSARELFTASSGNSAGPSRLPVVAEAEPWLVLPKQEKARSPKTRASFERFMERLLAPTLRAAKLDLRRHQVLAFPVYKSREGCAGQVRRKLKGVSFEN